MRRSIIIALVLLTEFFSTVAAAEAREYRITLGGGASRIFDDGLLATTDSGWISGADLGFMAEVGASILVGARIRGMTGREPGFAINDLNGSVGTLELLATARWNIEILKWLRPFMEIEAGAVQGEINFKNANIEDTVWGGMAAGMAGIELRLPPGMLVGKRFTVGLDLAGGYGWRSPLEFSDKGTALGSLNLHGALYRIALTAMW